MGKTTDLLKKIGDIKGTFHAKMDMIKDKNGKDLTEVGASLVVQMVKKVEKWKSLSRVRLFATPWTIQFMEFSRPEYWSG